MPVRLGYAITLPHDGRLISLYELQLQWQGNSMSSIISYLIASEKLGSSCLFLPLTYGCLVTMCLPSPKCCWRSSLPAFSGHHHSPLQHLCFNLFFCWNSIFNMPEPAASLDENQKPKRRSKSKALTILLVVAIIALALCLALCLFLLQSPLFRPETAPSGGPAEAKNDPSSVWNKVGYNSQRGLGRFAVSFINSVATDKTKPRVEMASLLRRIRMLEARR